MTLPAALWFCTLLPAQTITVSPPNESNVVKGTRQYTAAVTGLSSSNVLWSVNGATGGGIVYGTISSAGIYTGPATVPANPVITITATSLANKAISGSATATIRSAGPVLTSLSATSLPTGTFTLTVNGTGFQPGAAVWLTSTALTTTYVSATQVKASGTMNTAGTQAVRVMNPGSMYSNPLSLTFTTAQHSSITVQPASVSLPQGGTQQFTALLNGTTQQAKWTVTTAGGGTITAAGLYTAPSVVPNPPTVTISAAVTNYPAATATVTVVSSQPPAVSSISVNPLPIGVVAFGIIGQGFTAASQATLGGAPLATQYVSAAQLTVTGFAAQGGLASLVVNNGALLSNAFSVQVGPANPQVSASAARHFLQQAAFGPTPADAAHVQQVGFSAWLGEQFALPKSSNYQGLGSQGGMPTRFLTNAVMQPDQLRQRVAFALSQIFTTSINKLIWNTSMGPYQEMLMTDAFSSYRQILQDVTLSPGMGQFLDMANNGKANAAGTVLPNENYAREVLQLFSIGTSWLNADATRQQDSQGNAIPTYSQSTVSEFARVFTGWTYAPSTAGGAVVWGAYINPSGPMAAYQPMHDTGAKTLLSYPAPAGVFTTLAGGQSAQTDLSQALDNIATHPNVGPFICRQLIQHLVKSNPNPAYVQRVASVFQSSPQGLRGDMKAVVTAILLDPEARQNDLALATQAKDGHLQEPMLYLAGVLRAFAAQVNDQNYFAYDLANMSQDVYNAPSVFNYFSPGYVVPGYGVGGPEFQIFTPYSSVYRLNLVSSVFSSYSNSVQTYGPGTTIDLTPFVAMAGTPATLVGALDLTLTNGLMPAGLKQILVNAVTAETGGNLRRVQTAIYLVLSSGYYNVWN